MAVLPSPGGSSPTVSQVFYQNGLWQWWTQNNCQGTQLYNGVTEKGMDYANAWGTPIGVPVGGTVVRIVHNNNSIGDVVEIMAPNGAVWLYQHINASVRVGQTLSVGSIVGTENGLPIDQYSTGPHIEVRYAAPGTWKPTINSWNEPWINPYSTFCGIGNTIAGSTGGGTGGGGGSGGPGGGGSGGGPFGGQGNPFGANADLLAFLVQLDQLETLINPFIVTTATSDTLGIPSPVGGTIGPSVTFIDPISWITGFGTNLTSDLVAFLFRAILIFMGVVLCWGVVNGFTDLGRFTGTILQGVEMAA